MAATTSDWQRRLMRCFDAAIALILPSLLLAVLPNIDRASGVEYPLLILAGGLLLPACGELSGLYQPWRGRSLFTMLGVYALGWLLTIILLSLFLVATQSAVIFSRAWMLLSSLGVLAAGLLLRTLLYVYLRRIRSRGRNIKKVLLIGAPANMARIQHRLESMPYLGYQIAARLIDEPMGSDDLVARVKALASRSVFRRDFDEVWLTYPLASGDRVKQLSAELMVVPVDIRYFPDLTDVRLLNHRVTQVADMFSLDLNRSPLDGAMRLFKALEDRLLGLALFVVFLPLMLGIATALRWQMGRPVLFKQYRHGLDGKRFRIYKFRTMTLHHASGTPQAIQGDPRITPLGAFLRRTSLDELPQLYNVLQGRMSLVGPRPHAMDHNEYYKDEIETYMQRHRVKPGMTGWAQVNGLRGITDDVALMRKRVEYDLYYIDNWSLGFDLKILLMTVTRGFVNRQP
ncbi:undecaprenyl-phosphate glucose phosphotransferase [Halomonas lysinitropha]|uniref:UDP-glucose:undecaprenyl-phosphate glucose-1-phosphate transferase n=1 Tax=Halomonas lysinitropha TaxID=2607506 RepID=A0A5K1I0B8_9GAMM|nr:undecaprenyl-phosphate glucose phosphotransferase [Halomonas lysinitropha]VVZ95264.1 UDP-glucose:undecaprenyl-phosphate glucose-1-phosphate transferase [Halomonas lysinitropha]